MDHYHYNELSIKRRRQISSKQTVHDETELAIEEQQTTVVKSILYQQPAQKKIGFQMSIQTGFKTTSESNANTSNCATFELTIADFKYCEKS